MPSVSHPGQIQPALQRRACALDACCDPSCLPIIDIYYTALKAWRIARTPREHGFEGEDMRGAASRAGDADFAGHSGSGSVYDRMAGGE